MLRRSNVGSANARKSLNKVSAPSVATRLARAVAVERLEERWVLASITANNVAELISAINTANANNESDTIVLAKQTYTLTAQDNFWYGPNGLPAITSDITIDGNGATIERSSAADTPKFRLFYVAGHATVSPTLSFGTLTLNNLTLQGGLAKGGDGGQGGGGGMGAGGAVFNHGTLTLNGVLALNNTAQGGSSVSPKFSSAGGGGGIGGDGGGVTSANASFAADAGGGGGGFGGNGGLNVGGGFTYGGSGGGGYSGNGGSGAVMVGSAGAGGGGGGGITNGSNALGAQGGLGAGSGGNGGHAALDGTGLSGGNGGLFGGGGGGGTRDGHGGNGGFAGGGGGAANALGNGGNGGVGGGGGGAGGGFLEGLRAGDGGFGGGGGGGGGSDTGAGGNGGFGGGGGTGSHTGALRGTSAFGGGNGGKIGGLGGGGAGLGGGIFNDGGTVTVTNSTFTANSAIGGNGVNNGQGLGGGIFTRNGTLNVYNSTLSLNVAADGGRQLFQLGDVSTSTAEIRSSILGQSDTAIEDYTYQRINSGTAGFLADAASLIRTGTTTGFARTGDPLLATLADNGGYTKTLRPRPGSTTLNTGDNPSSLSTDQRGTGFARVIGTGADIGAYERDEIAPTVTVNQNASQADPAKTGPVVFDVKFSKPVTGFDAADVDLSASTAGGTLSATVSGSGDTYTVSVSGMTSAGTVVASVKANGANDIDENNNTASTSTDSTVSYDPNATPTSTGIADKTVREDSGTAVVNLRDFFADNEDGAAGLTYTIVGNTNTALLSSIGVDDPTDQLSLTPAADANGAADITIRATDAGGKWVEDTFTFNVTPVSDISIGDVSQAEGSGGGQTEFIFPVTRDDATGIAIVDFATADGSAGNPGDYLTTAGSVVFADGETSNVIKVYVKTDNNIEADQDFFVNLTNPSAGSSITRASGRGLIINDDSGTPDIAVSDVSVNEGNSGTKVMTFTVTLSRPTDQLVTVKYATVNGTATSGTDYVAANGTLKFIPRQTTATVSITIKGDTSIEGDESFRLNLSSATNATIADNQGVGVILNDDRRPVLTVADVSVAEGTGSGFSLLTFTLKLDKAATGNVTVQYTTANGTASSSSDYVAKGGTITFLPGQLSKTVTVQVRRDSLREGNETLFLNLSALTGPATLGRSRATGTIRNDD